MENNVALVNIVGNDESGCNGGTDVKSGVIIDDGQKKISKFGFVMVRNST